MTIDEKLSHFYDVTIADAQAKAAGISGTNDRKTQG